MVLLGQLIQIWCSCGNSTQFKGRQNRLSTRDMLDDRLHLVECAALLIEISHALNSIKQHAWLRHQPSAVRCLTPCLDA